MLFFVKIKCVFAQKFLAQGKISTRLGARKTCQLFVVVIVIIIIIAYLFIYYSF